MSAEQAAVHVPVLKAEVLQWMQPRPGGVYVDATLGLGGHTLALLQQSAPSGRVIGFEWDSDARVLAEKRLGKDCDRVHIVRASYAQLLPELKKLIGEFGKIGSNLNQIARYFNSGGIHSQEMRKYIQQGIADIFEMKHEVLKMAGDLHSLSAELSSVQKGAAAHGHPETYHQ